MPIDPQKVQWDSSPIDAGKIVWDTDKVKWDDTKPKKGFLSLLVESIKPKSGVSIPGIPSPAIGEMGMNVLDQAQLLATAGVGSAYRDESFKELYEKQTRPSDLMGIKNQWAKMGVDIVVDPLNLPIIKAAQVGLKVLRTTKNVERGKKIVAAVERINKTDPELIRKMKEEDLIAAFNSEDAVKKINELEKKLQTEEFITRSKTQRQADLDAAFLENKPPIKKPDELKSDILEVVTERVRERTTYPQHKDPILKTVIERLDDKLAKRHVAKNLTGKEFVRGTFKALTDDMKSGGLYTGVPLPTQYDNLSAFLNKHKIKLTGEEIAFLTKEASVIAKNKLMTSEKKQQKMVEMIEGFANNKFLKGETVTPEKSVLGDVIQKAKEADVRKVGQAQFKAMPEEARNIIKLARDTNPEGVGIARKEVQSHVATEQLAEGLKPEVARKITQGLYEPGVPKTAEEALAMKYVVADRIDDIFENIIRRKPDKIVEQVTGEIAGAGRRLESEKIKVHIDRDKVQKIRDRIANEPDPAVKAELEKIAKYVGLDKRDINPNMIDKFVEWSVMIKLTGLSTHVRAMVGNSSMLVMRFPEKVAAGAYDALVYGARKAIGKEAQRNVYAKEALHEFMGAVTAMKQGGRKAMMMLKHPSQYYDEATKAGEVIYKHGAIGKGGRVGGAIATVMRKVTSGKVGFDFGEVVRSPGRLIGAEDVLFKEMNYGSEIYAMASRKASQEGLRGTKYVKRMNELIENPTDEMIKIAKESAREKVFQQELNKYAQVVNEVRRRFPLTRLIIPFWNTPVNLFKQAIQRTPLSVLMPSTIKAITKGTQLQRSVLMGRMITGSAIGTGITFYALEGNISGGGPRSKAKRDVLRLTGWQPYSIKVGNAWVGYRGFEPTSSWFRAAADMATGLKEGKDPEQGYIDFAANFPYSFAKEFAENPFFMGIHDIYEVFDDPEKNIGKFFGGLAVSSTLPVLLQQWGTRVYDPVIREPKTFTEGLISRMPFGASEKIAPRRDIFGQPIVRENPKLQAFGFGISFEKGSRAEKELARLEIGVGKPSKTINDQELTDAEYERLYILKGAMLKTQLDKLINNSGYGSLPDAQKERAIRYVISNTNNFVRATEFEKYYRGGKK